MMCFWSFFSTQSLPGRVFGHFFLHRSLPRVILPAFILTGRSGMSFWSFLFKQVVPRRKFSVFRFWTEYFLRRKVESVKRSFLHGFPGKSPRGRVALFVGVIAPALGIIAFWLIDWDRRDDVGNRIHSTLAQIVALASFMVTLISFALFLWFEFLAWWHSTRSKKDASGDTD